VRSLRADFVMNFDNPLLRQTTTSRGTIHQRQPDRIALRFTDPDGDVILGDGQFFWVYYPSVNAQQVIRSPAAASGETGVNLQAQFVGDPVERFRYELHGTETVAGRAAHVLTLVPRERADYRSLKVWVDSRDGLVRRFEITEHNGNMRRFDLSNLQVNPTIPESVFRFTPPAGARIVDAG
jgi:outer membrane lipoprotein carrier protein